ncbi:MAG: tetratricopeptide repeat protein [Paracoccaceae bacterium]|nr:tetratricopeptide repeat protein [Paracoccaceae bacterium]
MLKDKYGNAISVQSQVALDHYDRGVQLFLGANYGAVEAFRAAVDVDDSFALGFAALARAFMMAGRMPDAQAAIATAQDLSAKLDSRQRQHVECFALLLAGNPQGTRALVKQHVEEFPRDVLTAQLNASVYGLIGFSGHVGREAELLAYTGSLMPHCGDDWWMMSMHALSLCETGQIDRSNELMAKSLAINPRNANGAHFKSHAQYEGGEAVAGRSYLKSWLVDYDDRSLLHGHLSWHAALWALQDGDIDAMWHVIDNGIGPSSSKGLPLVTLTDTAAILYRAKLVGVSVDPKRWSVLSDYAAKFFPETGQSFADIHAALSHAMAGNGDRLAYIADTAKGFAGDLVKPVARAWREIANENWAVALEELTIVMGQTERFGGSRAQRDILELTYANVLLKLGHSKEAHRYLSTHRTILAKSPPLAGLV